MKWSRDEYLSLMSNDPPGRQMFCELFGLLVGLDKEWEAQGASEDELDLTGFCFDYVPVISSGASTGLFGDVETIVLEENEDLLITRDSLGRVKKLIKKSATIPLIIEYPVIDMESWKRVKPYFEYCDERIDIIGLQNAAKKQKEGFFITESIPGAFNMPRELMGEEMFCFALYDQPELIHDMLDTLTETACRVFEKSCDYVIPDSLCVHEDMAGKTGPMMGPDPVRRFFKPYYSTVWNLLKQKGVKLFSQDSDGNMNAVMDAMIDCGVNVFYPLEPAAGMDIVRLREKYGRQIFFKGGIDKHVLRESKEAIHKELKYKINPLLKEGGCVFALDHRITNGTPLDNYRYYVDTARDMLGLPPRNQDEKGWARMAF